MIPDPGRGATALASLRRYVRPRAAVAPERCNLCGVGLPPEHAHLLESETRQLSCACGACALLFSGSAAGRYRCIPRDAQHLADFRLSDADWDSLGLPIDLAFFVHSTPAEGIIAVYPGPAGGVESLVSPETWEHLAEENPVLRELEPDVEAMLVNRVGEARECYRVGIDECYKLIGLIRTKWRGLSGGQEVHEAIGQMFARLKERSS